MLTPIAPGFGFPLEKCPSGQEPTSNRAELRAVITPLGLREWRGEGFDRLVIGTDSEYVIKGVSQWALKWKKNGWKTSTGVPVKNMDLWKELLRKVENLENKGTSVQFFQLKKEWNTETRALARKGAVCPSFPLYTFINSTGFTA
jgi:ribonuclease HI